MKLFYTSIIKVAVAMTTMLPIISYAGNASDIPEISDIKNTGCLSKTRAITSPVLLMTKEGDVVTCELQGYYANCGVDYFNIASDYKEGKDAPDSLFLDVSPVVPSAMDCTCPYNVSFTIHNVKADSFFLYCWVHTGMVSFKQSSQVKLEISREYVTLDDGSRYYLYKPSQQAMLYRMAPTATKDDIRIPSSVSYEGLDYTVVSFVPDAFNGKDATKLILPRTIRRLGENNEELYNCFNGRKFPKLEAIEVESGCHMLSSVDNALYSGDRKIFYCLPSCYKKTEYTVIDGVEIIGKGAFWNCSNLKSILLPKSITTIRPQAFSYCENLESIYIPSTLNREELSLVLSDVIPTVTFYVPESEVEYIKTLYKGPVLPLSSFDQTVGISDVNRSTSTDSYDLQGRRLTGKPAKGVFIEDGRKKIK